jgi:hypothetical protein
MLRYSYFLFRRTTSMTVIDARKRSETEHHGKAWYKMYSYANSILQRLHSITDVAPAIWQQRSLRMSVWLRQLTFLVVC